MSPLFNDELLLGTPGASSSSTFSTKALAISKQKNLKDEALQLNYCEQTQFSKVSSATKLSPRTKTRFGKHAHFGVLPTCQISSKTETPVENYVVYNVPWVAQSSALLS